MGMRLKSISLISSLLIILLLICLLLIAYGSQHTVPRGVKISGWTLNGMTIAQMDFHFKNIIPLIGEQQVTFTCNGLGCDKQSSKNEPFRQSFWKSTKINLRDLGVKNNFTEIAASLHSVEEGNWLKRAWTRWRLRNTAYNVQLNFDETKLLEAIQHNWLTASRFQPINAYRKIDIDDSIHIFPEINAYRMNIKELSIRLLAIMPNSTSPWLLQLKQGTPLAMNINLPLEIKKPSITSLSLQNQGITSRISQFTTEFSTSAAGRIHNISVSAQTMQDQLLAPGEIFDYSQIIRQTEKSFGYQEAPVIYNGKLVPGIGGGICQVSTTLYNAVLRAGLQIIERRNHSLPVSYVPLGQDATYSTGYINFRFRNNTEHFILIRSSIEQNTLTVKLFGTFEKTKSFDITSNIVKRLQPATKYLFNAALAPNEKQTLQLGKLGYIVETYRFQKENGVIKNKEMISRDTYPSQPTLVAVGKGGKVKVSPEEPNLLEDGVSGPNFGR
jgi:hypothetical protein